MKKILISLVIVCFFGSFGEVYGLNYDVPTVVEQKQQIKDQKQQKEQKTDELIEKGEKKVEHQKKIVKQKEANLATPNLSSKQQQQRQAALDKAKVDLKKAETKLESVKKAKQTLNNSGAGIMQKDMAERTIKQITKNNSFKIDPNMDLIALIDKSSTFDVSGKLKIGNEGDLTINAQDEKTNILHKALNLMIKVMGTLAVLLYVVGGFFYITSQGDENQVQKGKTIITYTSLGLAIAFSSYLLVYLIMSATFTLS